MTAVPAGWFTKATCPVLTAYCRHATRAEMLAALANAFKPEWIEEAGGLQRLDKLLAMADREKGVDGVCEGHAVDAEEPALLVRRGDSNAEGGRGFAGAAAVGKGAAGGLV